MKYTVTDGVAFFECDVPSARFIQIIDTLSDGSYNEEKLESMESLKKAMATHAVLLGGNCIIRFKYGQKKSSHFWKSLFSKKIYWHGIGIVAEVNPENFE